jgi:hypothetical protein
MHEARTLMSRQLHNVADDVAGAISTRIIRVIVDGTRDPQVPTTVKSNTMIG